MIRLIISIALLGVFLTGYFLGNSTEQEMTDRSLDQEATKNVLGTNLQSCCTDPVTGFYRNGFCQTGPEDYGTHVVCAEMTQAFLDFTKSRGNDLCTAIPAYNFPGLKPGDKWCLCALRWKEAYLAGFAPPVILAGTHEKALQYVDLEILKANELK